MELTKERAEEIFKQEDIYVLELRDRKLGDYQCFGDYSSVIIKKENLENYLNDMQIAFLDLLPHEVRKYIDENDMLSHALDFSLIDDIQVYLENVGEFVNDTIVSITPYDDDLYILELN